MIVVTLSELQITIKMRLLIVYKMGKTDKMYTDCVFLSVLNSLYESETLLLSSFTRKE